jgi:dihydrolipoamide dehydrogenase
MADPYDVAVVGAGTGGYAAAFRAAQLGLRVALVERDERLGGTCLLRGCIPTKALLQSAAVMDTVHRASTWGIKAAGEPDWPRVLEFQASIVDKLVKGVTGLAAHRGVDVLRGTARLVPGGIEVDGAAVEARHVVIATGSEPKLLPDVTRSDHVITSDEAVSWDRAPASAVVIGAGAVGLEFASIYRSFGADVTLLEALPRLAPLEDEALSTQIARAYRKRGIVTAAGAAVTQIKETGHGVAVSYEAEGQPHQVEAEICLIAVGRAPVTAGLGLDEAGVVVTDRGFVQVDDRLATSVGGVWAIGDVASTPLQLAHVAFTEAMAVAERIAGQEPPQIDYHLIPRVTYCDPEIASVGRTEAQARDEGRDIEVTTLDLRAIGKANILAESGSVKVVAEAGDGPILGVHMIGPHVTDLIAEAMLATAWEATPSEVATLIHPHPSLTEGFGEAALALAGKALHSA